MSIELTPSTLAACKTEAIRAYPNEGCGFLIGPKMGLATQLIVVENIQDLLHTKDPKRFPRTATTAYSIDPKLQQQIFKAAEVAGEYVTGIFHSHPDHDAYFSKEDRTNAAPWGEPLLPGLAYVVVSVYKGAFRSANQFYWNDQVADFAEKPIA